MIDTSNSGYVVETKTGKVGRTFHKKDFVNGKIPVYLATIFGTMPDGEKVPIIFGSSAILCDPKTLKHIGFID